MRKIMFNDQYGLTAATLRGDKTMTRRIVKGPKKFQGVEDIELEFHRRWGQDIYYDCVVVDANGHELGQLVLPYEVGDVVAIAQAYRYVWEEYMNDIDNPIYESYAKANDEKVSGAGFDNKMFVKANLMPHRIRITSLWFERLQDISDEDCLKEGIQTDKVHFSKEVGQYGYYDNKLRCPHLFHSPRQAYASLIDRISGRGTWESNPWVIAYTYELVKED